MKLSAIRRTENRWALLAIVVAAQFLNIFAISWLPLSFEDGDSNLPVYEYRLISLALSVLLIWIFAPNALKYFKVRIGNYPKFYTAMIFIGLALGSLLFGWFHHFSILQSLDAILFSLFIGLDEEFFNRVFVYGLLERVGMEFAMAVSAIIFGAAHFTNYFYGNESFGYVLGHVIQAAGFGYVMVAIMITTGNVWIPVALHGLTDLRWVVMDSVDYSAIVSGTTNWFATIFATIGYIACARLILGFEKREFHLPKSWNGALRYLGLIE
jgi:membrane protease YdiL (CAAX protease family)